MPAVAARVLGLGQCCWDRIGLVRDWPGVDSKTELLRLVEQGGGPVATALVVLARLGISVQFCGRIGCDTEGRLISDDLQAEGVDCSLLQRDARGRSQTAMIIAEQGRGRRNVFWQRRQGDGIQVDERVETAIASAEILLLDDLDAEAALAAARIARAAGTLTVLDGGSLRPHSRELLPLIDHLVVSERFARQWLPGAEPEAALMDLARSGGQVTVTLGERGCLSLVEGQPVRVPAFPVDAVDTTGCGDVFHAGYVYGLLQEWPLVKILEFASACAALKARGPGGRFAPRRIDEVFDFLARHAPDDTWSHAED
ncbi:MAG: sugar kinase [Deltaproteobacteria bacterium]|nr:MAG: sugar kinase [Deltaproteobacteria bacterium]